jgi:hypothetical protein
VAESLKNEICQPEKFFIEHFFLLAVFFTLFCMGVVYMQRDLRLSVDDSYLGDWKRDSCGPRKSPS